MLIRRAIPTDAAAICDIWNVVIRDTLLTFTSDEKSPDALRQVVNNRGPAFLVAETEEGHLIGFASYGAFRPGPGYDFTREHTVMMASSARGQGIGRMLMEALEQVAISENVMSLIGGVSGANSGGISFHQSLGFEIVGRIPKAGHKSGQWIELIFMQKLLTVPH